MGTLSTYIQFLDSSVNAGGIATIKVASPLVQAQFVLYVSCVTLGEA